MHDVHQMSAKANSPTFATHGQLIFGEGPVYLSHLPMFMYDPLSHPHNFQVILEVTLTDDGSKAEAIYVEDRKKNRDQRVYTLAPEPFDITDLKSGSLKTFKGMVFRGHFERGGQPIPDEKTVVDVNVEKVIYFESFLPEAKGLNQLKYLLFGKGGDLFLAHVITRPPDFDQILAVDVFDHGFKDEELGRGIWITIPGKQNSASERLKEGERASGEFNVRGSHQIFDLVLEARSEIYFEEGELSRFCDPCGEDLVWHEAQN